MARARLLSILFGLVLSAAASAAQGSVAAVGASGQIAGSGTTYTLTITNTGDQPILCFQFFVRPPVVATGVQGPAGWTVMPLGGGVAVGGQNQAGIPAGGSAAFQLTTNQPLPTVAGSEPNYFLEVSGTCQPNSDVNAQINQVPLPPPPCDCMALSVNIDPTLLRKNKVPATKQAFGVGFSWTLDCTAGTGGCKGEIDFVPPRVLAGKLASQRGALKLSVESLTVSCAGPCAQQTTDKFQLKVRSQSALNHLYGRAIAFKLELFCLSGGKRVPAGTDQVTVQVDQKGRLKLAP